MTEVTSQYVMVKEPESDFCYFKNNLPMQKSFFQKFGKHHFDRLNISFTKAVSPNRGSKSTPSSRASSNVSPTHVSSPCVPSSTSHVSSSSVPFSTLSQLSTTSSLSRKSYSLELNSDGDDEDDEDEYTKKSTRDLNSLRMRNREIKNRKSVPINTNDSGILPNPTYDPVREMEDMG